MLTRFAGLIGLFVVATQAGAQPTEFYGCLADSVFCSERPGEFVESSCGSDFYFFNGRVSTPVLRAAGPVTIAVNTRVVNMHYKYPLYVEIVWTPNCEPTGIHTRTLVMDARGLRSCGGVWESLGPFAISPSFVPEGDLYTVQLTFIESDPPPFGRSVAVSCVRVTSEQPSIAHAEWGLIKSLFR